MNAYTLKAESLITKRAASTDGRPPEVRNRDIPLGTSLGEATLELGVDSSPYDRELSRVDSRSRSKFADIGNAAAVIDVRLAE